MSKNIYDTKTHIVRENVNELIKELDNILERQENISDHDYMLKKKFRYLQKNFPSLFNLIVKEYNLPNFNKSRLEIILDTMLKQIEKIQQSQMTQHDASVLVGEHLAQTFIPQLKK